MAEHGVSQVNLSSKRSQTIRINIQQFHLDYILEKVNTKRKQNTSIISRAEIGERAA